MSYQNALLIDVIKRGIYREEEKMRRAEAEIFKLECELYDLGVELPLPAPHEAREAAS